MEMDGDHTGSGRLLFVYLRSAILAMEPPDCVIFLARQSGGGSLTMEVQNFILRHCIKDSIDECNYLSYIKSILKKVIVCAESNNEEVVDGIYELYTFCISSCKGTDSLKASKKVVKEISFLLRNCSGSIDSKFRTSIVPLRCSLNLLEGDTGCAIWPSSLFLSEFILSYPDIFTNKSCFELGSGVGLVGITLAKVNVLKVVLSDGDLSSLSNLKFNLQLNKLDCENQIDCKFLNWETANEVDLEAYLPEIILGADVIYNPACLPHLLRVLATLLIRKTPSVYEGHAQDFCVASGSGSGKYTSFIEPNHCSSSKADPVAYIATVIRNVDTFNYFLKLAGQTNLSVTDITESIKILDLLPYMLSYDRANVHLYKVSASAI